jgi:hypothetical protein
LKKGYQLRPNLVTNESGDMLEESNNILNRWKNDFSLILNVYMISDVRQTEIHTAEPLVPQPSPFEVEIAVVKLKSINCQVLIKLWQS